MTRLQQTGDILAANPLQCRILAQQDARLISLVLGKQMGLAHFEAAEVKEAKRPVVYGVPVWAPAEASRVQVPIRDVIGTIPQDDVIEKRRHEVHPPLIREHHAGGIRSCPAPGLRPPPLEKCLGAWTDGDEAEVEDSRREDLKVIDSSPVGWQRYRRMWREHNRMAERQS